MSSISTNNFASGIGQANQAAQLGDGFAEMTNQEFLQVMFAELQNQDPLEPQDSQALLEQMSNLRNIESQLQLQETMEDLVLQNQIASAGNLIGKQVMGLGVENDQISGVIKAIRVENEEVVLETEGGLKLPMDRVVEVTDAEQNPV